MQQLTYLRSVWASGPSVAVRAKSCMFERTSLGLRIFITADNDHGHGHVPDRYEELLIKRPWDWTLQGISAKKTKSRKWLSVQCHCGEMECKYGNSILTYNNAAHSWSNWPSISSLILTTASSVRNWVKICQYIKQQVINIESNSNVLTQTKWSMLSSSIQKFVRVESKVIYGIMTASSFVRPSWAHFTYNSKMGFPTHVG